MLNPYPKGPLGVIQEGACADVLLIDGNPIKDLLLLLMDKKDMPVIMKDGKIHKNALRELKPNP